MRQLREAALDLIPLLVGVLLLAMAGCTFDQQLIASAVTKQGEAAFKEFHDREAGVYIQLPCSTAIGGAIRVWSTQQLVNQLENCGLDLRDLHAELSLRQRSIGNLY